MSFLGTCKNDLTLLREEYVKPMILFLKREKLPNIEDYLVSNIFSPPPRGTILSHTL